MMIKRSTFILLQYIFVTWLMLIFLLPFGEDYQQYLINFRTGQTKSIFLDFASNLGSNMNIPASVQLIIVSSIALVLITHSSLILEKIFNVKAQYFFFILVFANFGNDWLSHIRSNLAQVLQFYIICNLILHRWKLKFYVLMCLAPFVHLVTILLIIGMTLYTVINRNIILFFIASSTLLNIAMYVYSYQILGYLVDVLDHPSINFYFYNRLVPNLSMLAVIEKLALPSFILFSIYKLRLTTVDYLAFAYLYVIGVLLFFCFSYDPNMAGRFSKPFNSYGYVCLVVALQWFRPLLLSRTILHLFVLLKFVSSVRFLF